ncbi:unnamed protein product, partial [Phaeothamnion confervicola]
ETGTFRPVAPCASRGPCGPCRRARGRGCGGSTPWRFRDQRGPPGVRAPAAPPGPSTRTAASAAAPLTACAAGPDLSICVPPHRYQESSAGARQQDRHSSAGKPQNR